MSHPVVTQEGAEVWSLLLVNQLNKAGTVNSIDGGEDAAREQAELQELGDGLILCGFCWWEFQLKQRHMVEV